MVSAAGPARRDEPDALGRSPAQVAAELAASFPALYRRFRATSQLLPGSDVTSRMLSALHHLAASGPLTVGELAVHLGTGKATATELVGRLETRGLVERMRDERDRRRVFVWLTADGRRRTRQHPRVLEDSLLEDAVRAMRPADRRALLKGLRALLSTDQTNQQEGIHHERNSL